MFPTPRFSFAKMPPLGTNTLIVAVVVFVTVFANVSFYTQVFKVFPPSGALLAPLATLPLATGAVTLLFVAPFCFGRATRAVLVATLVISAVSAAFMDSYGVVIDRDMLRNAMLTHTAEVLDLINGRFLAYLALLGVLPAWLVSRLPLARRAWRDELRSRLKLLAGALALVFAAVVAFNGFYASLSRSHRFLREYANPTFPLYSAVGLLRGKDLALAASPVTPIGTDAHKAAGQGPRELVLVVVGEAARADHFSLNGYARDTNPRLAREAVSSFTNVWACGTSTAVSVPCMFSNLGTANYDDQRAKTRENVLDVLQHAGARVVWLDNNSDSKSVALRVGFEDFRDPKRNPLCDVECRDEGMLRRVGQIVDEQKSGDIVVVLHQMGNHGPAYFKRYPDTFERFRPACRNKDLGECSREEIVNAYDNAIVYTDHFLARAIELLKGHDGQFRTALLYMSDHGESLGENGAYLHGLPRLFAPEAQLHVPALLWLGAGFDDVDRQALARQRDQRYSHDHLFHTLLGLLEVETEVYRRELDLLAGSRRPLPPPPPHAALAPKH